MRKYLKQFVALLGEEGSARIFSFLVSIYIARSFAKEDYGIIIFATALMSNLSNIGDLGMLPLGFAEASKPEHKREFSPEKIFQTRVLGLAFVMLVTILITTFSTLSLHHKTVSILFLLAIMIDAISPVWYFKAMQKFHVTTAVKSITSLCYFIIAFAAIQFYHDVIVIPISYLLVYSAGAFYLLKKSNFKLCKKPNSENLAIYKTSFKVGIGKIAHQLPNLLPPLLITWFATISPVCSLEKTAGFGAAWRLILAFNIADRIIRSIFLSSLPKQWDKNPQRTTEVIKRLFTAMILIGSVAILLITLFSTDIMTLIYADKYSSNGITLAMLSLFLLFSMLNSMVSFGILAIGKAQDFMKASIIPAVITLPLMIILVYFYAENGAALGVTIVEMSIFLSSLFYFKKNVPLPMYPLLLLIPLLLFMTSFFFTESSTYSIMAIGLLIVSAIPISVITFKGKLRAL